MKKLLMISYSWPPAKGVSWIRASKFAKYLKRCGWNTTVITAKGDHFENHFIEDYMDEYATLVRTEYSDRLKEIKSRFPLKKRETSVADAVNGPPQSSANGRKKGGPMRSFSRFFREMAAMPDEKIGWMRYAVQAAMVLIEKEHFDAVFSTSPPETAHLIAYEIKKKTGLPWAADLRDLWSGYHFYYRGFVKTMLLKSMEKKILSKADALITVSEPWAKSLKAGLKGKQLHVITNGFDEEDYGTDAASGRSKDTFLLLYTGKLHKQIQNPKIFFEALGELVNEKKIDKADFEAHFYLYGYDKPDIKQLASDYKLSGVVFERPAVSHARCMRILKKASAFLFFGWSGREAYGHYSAKVFEYLGAGRPIIAVSALQASCVRDLIEKTKAGNVVSDKEELKEALLKLYNQHKNGGVVFNADESEIKKYSRRNAAHWLSGILNDIAEKGKHVHACPG